jgi:hypothetical protein
MTDLVSLLAALGFVQTGNPYTYAGPASGRWVRIDQNGGWMLFSGAVAGGGYSLICSGTGAFGLGAALR